MVDVSNVSAGDLAEQMLSRIADILLVVANVGGGDYSARLKSDLPDNHPLKTLYDGINQMITSLSSERERSLAYQKELEEQVSMIEVQRAAIRELSTPIIEIWEGILCLPVVGVLDSTRSADMTDALLTSVVEKKARCAVIDITGIQVMDTATADHFLRMARAVKLLGSECVLTGINPAIAQTMIHMGVDLSGISTHRSLRTALQGYVQRFSEADLVDDNEW
ncbi:MAG TPA: STAS domain-containing protein [Labilithrix sp.]|nr:STAS domain-containing protein [Labilithrix sp.]